MTRAEELSKLYKELQASMNAVLEIRWYQRLFRTRLYLDLTKDLREKLDAVIAVIDSDPVLSIDERRWLADIVCVAEHTYYKYGGD